MGRLRRGTSCARVSLATAPNGVRTSTAARAGTRRLRRALRIRAERRGDRLTGLDRLIEVAQRELQGAEEVQDVLQRHEAEVTDADELPVQLALPASDDRVVVVTQHTNEVARVDARRGTERGDGRRRMRFVGEQRQIERLQSPTGRAGEIQMTAEDRLEPFFGHEAERLLQRDVDTHRRRRGRRALLERGLRRGEVELRLWQVGLLVEFPRALAHRDDRDAGWRTPRLLRRGHADVDAPLIDLELGRTGAGDAVDDEELARLTDDLADLLERVENAGRRLVVLDQDRLRAVPTFFLRELIAHQVRLDRAPERHVDAASFDAIGLADRVEA